MDNEKITISKKEYDDLLEQAEFLEALKAQGVDNWDGYEDACESVENLND